MDLPPFDVSAWETLEPFRRTFLAYLPAEDRSRVVAFGDLLFELALARRAQELGSPSSVREDLRAIGEDLAYLSLHLQEHVLRARRANAVAAEEECWLRVGEWLAPELSRLATGLEHGLAAAKPAGEDTAPLLLGPWSS